MSENPCKEVQLQRVSPKLTVIYATSQWKVCGPFLFSEATVNGVSYLDALQQ